jgi:thymidylate synthase (FAD)
MSDSTTRAVVLDYGYVELVETWGSEERIIEAARMSTGKGFLGWGEDLCTNCGQPNREGPCPDGPNDRGPCNIQWKPGDEKLLHYLHTNAHATPFEMAGAIVEVKAPIFVFREWHRHRTQSYNEMSARYTPLPDENYVPTVERLMVNSKSNKQAGTVKGAAELTEKDAEAYRNELRAMYASDEVWYQEALRMGVPKELARVHLPVGRYSRMRASANLRNWLAFLTLREASGAQWEIRQYAGALHTILKTHFPRTLALHEEGKR